MFCFILFLSGAGNYSALMDLRHGGEGGGGGAGGYVGGGAGGGGNIPPPHLVCTCRRHCCKPPCEESGVKTDECHVTGRPLYNGINHRVLLLFGRLKKREKKRADFFSLPVRMMIRAHARVGVYVGQCVNVKACVYMYIYASVPVGACVSVCH